MPKPWLTKNGDYVIMKLLDVSEKSDPTFKKWETPKKSILAGFGDDRV